jgi:hypothetical protein
VAPGLLPDLPVHLETVVLLVLADGRLGLGVERALLADLLDATGSGGAWAPRSAREGWKMTQKKDLKRRVRERMEKTGERYAAALRQVKSKAKVKHEPGLEADQYLLKSPLRCQLVASRTVYRWALADGGRRLSERFAQVVKALDGDPAGVLFQRVIAGQQARPGADVRVMALDFKERLAERLRYARRLDLGLRGVSTDGCMLAFDYDGQLVVASISLFAADPTVTLDSGEELRASRDAMAPFLARLVVPRAG